MDAIQQVLNRLNGLKQQLKNERDINERNRLRETIAITEITRNKRLMFCDYIAYIKENIVNKIENDEWDIKYLEQQHFVKLIDIFLNQHEANTLQFDALYSLSTIFVFINKINTECNRSFDKIQATYSSFFDDKIFKLFKQLKKLILSNNMNNTEILILAILVLKHLHIIINDEYIDTKLCRYDLPLLSNLCNLSSHIEILHAVSFLSDIFIKFIHLSDAQYVDEIIGNLNLLITYDEENILESAICSYQLLFASYPHFASILRENKLERKQFEEESEAKANEDESLVTMFVNNYHRKWKLELPPISLILLILQYFSPICRKNIKRKTLDPIKRFVELIIHPSQRVNTSVITLLYGIIVIDHVYIYLFDVNEMMVNLVHYMKKSEKSMFKAFNLMMCCVSFGDENIMKESCDIDVFVECIEKTLKYDQIDMDKVVFSGVDKLLTYYKSDRLAMNTLWNSLHKMQQQEEIDEDNLEFINQIKHMML